MLHSPADCAAALVDGVSAVIIGGVGYGEWLRAASDSILTAGIPGDQLTIICEAAYE
jgi:hypothetical protein